MLARLRISGMVRVVGMRRDSKNVEVVNTDNYHYLTPVIASRVYEPAFQGECGVAIQWLYLFLSFLILCCKLLRTQNFIK